MKDAREKIGHGEQALTNPIRNLAAVQFFKRNDLKVILQHAGVIHGAAFIVTAVGQDLFPQSVPKNPESGFAPARAGFVSKEDSSEDHRSGVGQEVVSLQVVFEMIFEIARLLVEACQPRGLTCTVLKELLGRDEADALNPVGNAARDGIRVPGNALANGIGFDPLAKEAAQ